MRTRRTVIILVSGKAGSGKSTVAELLTEKLQNIPSLTVMQYGFSDPIKYIARAYAMWDGQKDEKGRRLLQQIGAVWREYDQDIWVKHFLSQLDKRAGMFPFNFAIVSDWRFPNELAYLQKNPLFDIVTIRVFGRGGLDGPNAMDVSENSLPEADFSLPSIAVTDETPKGLYDYKILNQEDLDSLEKKVDWVLASLAKQYIVE